MKYEGNDNYGRPKSEYLDKLKAMNDAALEKEAENKIWLSAYAANNRRSDFHWHVDAVYDECISRDKAHIYNSAYKSAFPQ
jgi:hypothetical protein